MSARPLTEVRELDIGQVAPGWGQPVAVRADEAAGLLRVSRDFFDQRIAPDLPVIDLGRVKLYAVSALQEWAARADRGAGAPPAPHTRPGGPWLRGSGAASKTATRGSTPRSPARRGGRNQAAGCGNAMLARERFATRPAP